MQNMDFLYAALILLGVVTFHFYMQKTLNDLASRLFRNIIVIGIADIVFDIITTRLLPIHDRRIEVVTVIALTIFYLLQIMVLLSLSNYVRVIRKGCQTERKITMWELSIIIMAVVIIGNLAGEYLFYFDAEGGYHKGPLYLLMYVFAGGYAIAIGISSMINRKKYEEKQIAVIWEFLVILAVCVGVQGANTEILTTGLGIAIGILVFYLTINHPAEYQDSLTGVFEVRYLKVWIDSLRLQKKKYHVISLDFYQLKQVNIIMGNSTGDHVLVQAAREIERILVRSDVFRVTGNRFLAFTYDLEEYERVRDELRERFEHEIHVEEGEFMFACVISGVTNAQKLNGTDELLGFVEYLYSTIKNPNGVEMIQSSGESLDGFQYSKEIEQFLETAIEEELFEVYFQPIYSTSENKYITLEALSRLRHPTLGPVSPDVFIQIAERNGKIGRIGYLQFRNVCRFVKENEWLLDTIKNIKFNMSPAELLKAGYAERMLGIMAEYGLPASFFQFEITETVATEYNENLGIVIRELLDSGIGICLDDFGSGYANMNTVLKLPFAAVKLDRSLLEGTDNDPQIAKFYRSIVKILQELGFSVISEGIETEKQKAMVSSFGVNMIQGYYFSKPLPGSEIAEILRKQREGENA